MFVVYIIQAELSKKYYIGCTDNLDRRLKEHNSGYSNYTKTQKNWNLKYKEEYENLADARKREKQIKSWKKRAAIEKLIVTGPIV